MNRAVWTTDSQRLSDFGLLHFCRYFPILFDSCGHSLLIIIIITEYLLMIFICIDSYVSIAWTSLMDILTNLKLLKINN